MKISGRDIVGIGEVLGKYSSYPEKGIGLYIMDVMDKIGSILEEVGDIIGMYREIEYKVGMLRMSHSEEEGGNKVFIPYEGYDKDIEEIKASCGWSAEREVADVSKFDEMMGKEYEIDIEMVSFGMLPNEMSSVELKKIRCLIDRVVEC